MEFAVPAQADARDCVYDVQYGKKAAMCQHDAFAGIRSSGQKFRINCVAPAS
jgi:hypothetical protein